MKDKNSTEDNAGERHYERSVEFFERQWFAECRKELEAAVDLDPGNSKYREALDRLNSVEGNPDTDPEKLGGQKKEGGKKNKLAAIAAAVAGICAICAMQGCSGNNEAWCNDCCSELCSGACEQMCSNVSFSCC